MDYKTWLTEEIPNRKVDEVQVRMISRGNDLISQLGVMYGVVFHEEGDWDYHDDRIGSRTLGRGEPTAPVAFRLWKDPMGGYVVKREHGNYWQEREGVGFSFTQLEADKIAYNQALASADEIAKIHGVHVLDLTQADLKEYVERPHLHLEDKVHDFEERFCE